MLRLFTLFAACLLPVTFLSAQESSAIKAADTPANWSALANQVNNLKFQNQFLSLTLGKLTGCQAIGKYYNPSSGNADANGCISLGPLIVGMGECMIPEAPTNNVWMPRNLVGTATGCNSSGQIICSQGNPTVVSYVMDTQSVNENGGFCHGTHAPGTPWDTCHISQFWCVL